jgi:hypothetical protein
VGGWVMPGRLDSFGNDDPCTWPESSFPAARAAKAQSGHLPTGSRPSDPKPALT